MATGTLALVQALHLPAAALQGMPELSLGRGPPVSEWFLLAPTLGILVLHRHGAAFGCLLCHRVLWLRLHSLEEKGFPAAPAPLSEHALRPL